MALTCVTYWDEEKGVRFISAEELEALCNENNNYETIRADSKLLRCSICGDDVLFTQDGFGRENTRKRHFRHRPNTTMEECEQKLSSYSKSESSFFKRYYDMPVKIERFDDDFKIYLGFIMPQDSEFMPYCRKIEIRGANIENIEYSRRIRDLSFVNEASANSFKRGITNYIELDGNLKRYYNLEYQGENDYRKYYWKDRVELLHKGGAFFYKSSGLKIGWGSKVRLNEEYLLLVREGGASSRLKYLSGIKYKELARKKYKSNDKYILYLIKPLKHEKKLANFFLDRGLLLSNEKYSAKIIWPPHINQHQLFFHNFYNTYIYTTGTEKIVASFPQEKEKNIITKLNREDGKIYKLGLNGRHQISFMRDEEVLSYKIFHEQNLKLKAEKPKITIFGKGIKNTEGEVCELRSKVQDVLIQAEFDGRVELYKNNKLIKIEKLIGDSSISIKNVDSDSTIKVYQGLDIIKEFKFKFNRRNQVKIDLYNLKDNINIEDYPEKSTKTINNKTQNYISNNFAIRTNPRVAVLNTSKSIYPIVANLENSNVKSEFADLLAAHLYSIYKHKANILLAGKFAEYLANAFSISVIGKPAYVLNCEDKYDRNLLKSAINSQEKIIIIKNGLRDEWVNILRNRLTNKEKTFIWISDNPYNISEIPNLFFKDTYPLITDIFFDREKSLSHSKMLYCKNINSSHKESNDNIKFEATRYLQKYSIDNKKVDKILKTAYIELKRYRAFYNIKGIDPKLFEIIMMAFPWGVALDNSSLKNIVKKNGYIKDDPKFRIIINELKNMGD
ncbi:MAG: hypothetical protein Q4P29_06845 [Tissierellia bacterium]|nr:hypothetical protein [Tissierellia bacterium]